MQEPVVIRPDQLRTETAQTSGMSRIVAIDEASTPASKVFLGFGQCPPRSRSAVHHHGEAETAVYCIRGRQRVYYGENFEKFIEFGEGDFAYIPPHMPHIEVNDWDEEYFGIIARSPSNIVVNLDE